MTKKPLVVFYRASAIEILVAINDRKNSLDSVKIESYRTCNTATIGNDINFAYNIFSKYINDQYETMYASFYIPSADLSITNWEDSNPCRIFLNDTFYAAYAMLHKERGLNPTYIVSGYNYFITAINLSDLFREPVIENLTHKSTNIKKIYMNKPEAYFLSDHWPIDIYNRFSKESSILFRWYNQDLRNKIEWTTNSKRKRILKRFIITIAWFECRKILDEYASDTDGKITFGFRSKPFYWYCQNLIEDLYDNRNANEINEAFYADLLQIIFDRLFLSRRRAKVNKAMIDWHKRFIPSHQLYLPKCKRYITEDDVKNLK